MFRGLLFAFSMLALLFVASECLAQTYVRPYLRSNGTYVQGHYRSLPDGNFGNNWSTYPNVNPYTGSIGSRHYPSYPSYQSYPSYPSYRSYGTPSYRSYGTPTYRPYRYGW